MNPEPLPLFPDLPLVTLAARSQLKVARDRLQTEAGAFQKREASDGSVLSWREEPDDALSALPPQYLALPSLLFTGDARAMAHFALSRATQWLVRENTALRVLDAGNAFNPYVITRQAQRTGVPAEGWLRRVFVARAFTPYQTLTLLERLCDEECKMQKVKGKSQKEELPASPRHRVSASPFPRFSASATNEPLCPLSLVPCHSPLTTHHSLLILLPFDGLEDAGFSGRERAYLARKILRCLHVLASARDTRFWVVERDPAPVLEPFFRALLTFCEYRLCGEWRDNHLSLRLHPGRGGTLPRPTPESPVPPSPREDTPGPREASRLPKRQTAQGFRPGQCPAPAS